MAHADLDLLFDHLIELAQKLLQENGGFLPLGAVVETDGQVRYVAAMDDKQYPGAQPLLDVLTTEFRSMAASGAIRASGICFDVLVAPYYDAPKRDAIQCRMEHSNGEALDVFMPIRRIRPARFDTRMSMRRSLRAVPVLLHLQREGF